LKHAVLELANVSAETISRKLQPFQKPLLMRFPGNPHDWIADFLPCNAVH